VRYRKRPVEVDAILWDGSLQSAQRIRNEFGSAVHVVYDEDEIGLYLGNHAGMLQAKPGDWVVKGTVGEVYPVTAAVFDDIYEAVA
jgi:hypothetical protein